MARPAPSSRIAKYASGVLYPLGGRGLGKGDTLYSCNADFR